MRRRIIYVDETSFSVNTVIRKGFSAKSQNCYHPGIQKLPEYLHLVAGISYENGIEGFVISK